MEGGGGVSRERGEVHRCREDATKLLLKHYYCRMKRFSEVFRGFQSFCRGFQRSFQRPSQRQISLSEAISSVAPKSCCPLELSPIKGGLVASLMWSYNL